MTAQSNDPGISPRANDPRTAPAGAIVVGVGLGDVDAALAYAADVARRTRRPLHLLHVLRVSGAEAYAGVYQAALEAADEALEAAVKRANDMVEGAVPVTSERCDDGWLVADLADHAVDAYVMVLQHRRLSRWHRLVTGSTVASLAARCAVPVVSVPEDWTPGASAAPVVTVAVQDPEEAISLVRQALEEAATRDARVVVLHAWWLYGGYDSVVSDREFRAEQERDVRARLAPALEAAAKEHPEIPLTVEVRHAPPVEVLLEASATSQVLVLGRRHHRLPFGSHLGPVTRAVLRDAPGPVLVCPEVRVPEMVSGATRTDG